MTTDRFSLAIALEREYQRSGDPDFGTITGLVPVASDSELADLIEADGRIRLRLQRPVDLDRYLSVIPDLSHRTAPIDAAIDMSLRALTRSLDASEDAIEVLVGRHPRLEAPIRDAAALNEAMWSTTRLNRQIGDWSLRELPADFGPTMHDGRHRYELQELLGEGAFGQVYLAVDRQLSEEGHAALVSLKVLPGTDRSEWERKRLVDEAAKARRVDHPNVARVIDRGISQENEDFIVYEYVAGGDLVRHVHRARPTARDAARLVMQIARGVHAAHMAGLVHCDLKPNNVVLTEDGTPKVADFGIAIRTDRPDLPMASEEDGYEAIGNLAFMSPEQFRAEPGALTIPSDIYALGGILYWLLTRAMPNGADPDAIAKTHDLAEGRREPPRLVPMPSGADATLEAICRRAMAVRPADRYSSAAYLADDLDAWLRHEPIGWTRPGVGRRLALWVRRKPVVAASVAAMFLISAASGLALWRLAVDASRRRLDAAVALNGLEKEEVFRDRLRKRIVLFGDRLYEYQARGLAHQVFPQIWLMEWLHGPTVIRTGPERFILWDRRVEAVRYEVERLQEAGRGDEITTMMWESALAFWLIEDGKLDEGIPVLDANIERWDRLLADDDTWLRQLRAMRMAAEVPALLEQAKTDDRDAALARMREIEPAMTAVDHMLRESSPSSPIHVLILRRLMEMVQPDVLDDAPRLEDIEAYFVEFDVEPRGDDKLSVRRLRDRTSANRIKRAPDGAGIVE